MVGGDQISILEFVEDREVNNPHEIESIVPDRWPDGTPDELVAQIGEQVDYLRFMPVKTEQNRRRWWFWLILAGPGWVLMGLLKMRRTPS